MAETVFTKIIGGEIPSAKVFEDENVYAFMDAGQVNPGHVIVASKRPAETLLDLSRRRSVSRIRSGAEGCRGGSKRFRT